MNGENEHISQSLVTQLKAKNRSIVSQGNQAIKNVRNFYDEIREGLNICEAEICQKFDKQLLKYHEQSSELVTFLTHKTVLEDENENELADNFLSLNISNSPVIDIDQMIKIIKKSFQLTISNKKTPSFKDVLESFLQEQEGEMSQNRDIAEKVIEKLQEERDYYQRRQIELQHRVSELQKKKGVNFKEMSRSYLEQKCSKLALERLNQENKMLKQQIGDVSQEFNKLRAELGSANDQNKKLNGIISQISGKSFVGTSTVKTYSMILDERNSRVLQSEQRKQRQLEVELKNEQLMIEITKFMTMNQELAQANQIMESKIEEDDSKMQQMALTIETLKQNLEGINEDYEKTLKKKAIFEQQNKHLRSKVDSLTQNLNQKGQAYQSIVNQLEQAQRAVVEKIRQIQESKHTALDKYEAKVRKLSEERDILRKTVEEISTKKGQEINYKSLLNEQIARLLRQNSNLSQELELKEHKIFECDTQNTKFQIDIATLQKKLEQNKKQMSKLKKHIKQLQKQKVQFIKRTEYNDQLMTNIMQCEQNYIKIVSEFNSFKDDANRKAGVYEKIIEQLKDKNSIEFALKQNQEMKAKGKKTQIKSQEFKKYRDENDTLIRKNALIKQLKEQIRQLKDGKEIKNLSSKKNKNITIEQSMSKINSEVFKLGTDIIEQRLNSVVAEKEKLQDCLRQYADILAKQQLLKKQIEEELEKEKLVSLQLKSKQKQEANNQNNIKIIKQKDDKINKLESELKNMRSMCKKLQSDKNDLESEVKKKRELAAGFKKQCKEKQQQIKKQSSSLQNLQNEVEKLKNSSKDVAKKEAAFKEILSRRDQLSEQNANLKERIEKMQETIRQKNKEIAKKDDILKEKKNIDQREVRVKEDSRLKQANEKISTQKQTISKLKSQVARKQQRYKILLSQKKQFQEVLQNKEEQIDTVQRECDLFKKKMQKISQSSKKQEGKNYLLNQLIKKIFAICINLDKDHSKIHRDSTQYYSTSTISPNQMKTAHTPASTSFRPKDTCQGFQILGLKPEDIIEYLGQTTTVKSQVQNRQETSWSMVSPIVNKNKELQKQQQLISGLQKLEILLKNNEIESNQIEKLFKNVLRAQ